MKHIPEILREEIRKRKRRLYRLKECETPVCRTKRKTDTEIIKEAETLLKFISSNFSVSRRKSKFYCDKEFTGKERCKYGQCQWCKETF